ncbi:MAG: glycosyltransferase family 2 protein [Gemmatimonadaceae bacterium]|nr:glycosyltransferase family 2 protein [Gemmatimonadaceae bacterium]
MIDPNEPDFANTPASEQRPRYAYEPVDPSRPPLVTIITPFYNTGPVFRETAESVRRQSLQQWEWIIINDGSTDTEALALLDEYALADRRIRIIHHQQNLGLSTARNTGFAAAATDYVVQLDSDDSLSPPPWRSGGGFLEPVRTPRS